ncbi:unnamed protein product [Anisakis simplex]|uniref:Uncharacterized protein n=1 Tax=Anisakis simplex TaxID=6269 RepID=A0A158PP03_ANISI|nr:unnamed protein product [Anisakis simplex]
MLSGPAEDKAKHDEERLTPAKMIENVQKREEQCIHGTGETGKPISYGEDKPAAELLDKVMQREGMALHGNGGVLSSFFYTFICYSLCAITRLRSMDFLAVALDSLEKNRLEELKELVTKANCRTLDTIFMDLFRALVTRYDELVDAGENVELLTDSILYIVENSGVKVKEMCKEELRDDIPRSFLKKHVQKQLFNEDISRECITNACHLFIRLFKLCECKDANQIEILLNEVLSCLLNRNGNAELDSLIDASAELYSALGQNPISSCVLIANSQNNISNTKPLISLVYSPEYRFELCLPALKRSLLSNTTACLSNANNISLIIDILQGFIPAIPERSLSRHQLPLFMDFFSGLICLCEKVIINERLHEKCVKSFVDSLERFEPVAQLIIVRQLIRLVKFNKIKLVMESQILGWLIDLIRFRLRKYPVFADELGFIWADLADIRYPELHLSTHFYTAVLVLAQYQALFRINKSLLKDVKLKVLETLQKQLADWTALIRRGDGDNDNYKDVDREAALHFLQFSLTETFNFVNKFVNEL